MTSINDFNPGDRIEIVNYCNIQYTTGFRGVITDISEDYVYVKMDPEASAVFLNCENEDYLFLRAEIKKV